MIVIGWAIAAVVMLTFLLTRHALVAAGKFAGAFIIALVLVPAFPASLTLLTGGTVTATLALRRRACFSLADRLLLSAGAVGVLAGLYIVGGMIYVAVRYP
jgi:hypothetical protein